MIVINQTTETIVIGPYTFQPGGSVEVSYNTGFLGVFLGTKGLTVVPTNVNERLLVHTSVDGVITQRARVKTMDEIKKEKNPQHKAERHITKEANAVRTIPAFVKKTPEKEALKDSIVKSESQIQKSEERVIYRSPSKVVEEYKKSVSPKTIEDNKNISLNNPDDVEGIKKLFSSKSIEEKMEKAKTQNASLSSLVPVENVKQVETVVEEKKVVEEKPIKVKKIVKKITKKQSNTKNKKSTNQELNNILATLG